MMRGILAARVLLFALTAVLASVFLGGASLNVGVVVVRHETGPSACEFRYKQCVSNANGNLGRVATCREVKTICIQNCGN